VAEIDDLLEDHFPRLEPSSDGLQVEPEPSPKFTLSPAADQAIEVGQVGFRSCARRLSSMVRVPTSCCRHGKLAGMLQIGDLIDVIAHGSRRALCVPAAQRGNHRLVSFDGFRRDGPFALTTAVRDSTRDRFSVAMRPKTTRLRGGPRQDA